MTSKHAESLDSSVAPTVFTPLAAEPNATDVSMVRDSANMLWRKRKHGWTPVAAHWFRRHETWGYLVANRGPLTAVPTSRTTTEEP